MPYLSRVDVANYRGFHEAVLELPPSGLVFIAGANNAGKSALLSTLDAARGLAIPLSSMYLGETAGHLRLQFTLDKDDTEALIASSPDWPTWLVPSSVELWFEGDAALGFWDLRAVWAEDPTGFRTAVLRARAEPDGTALERLISAGDKESPVWAPLMKSSDPRPVDLAHLPALHEWFARWATNFYHFHVLKRQIAAAGQMAAEPMLRADGSNLLQVLLHLNRNDNESWLELQALIGRLLPDVGVLRLPADGMTGRIAFDDPYLGRQQDLTQLGTGVEQLLMTFVVALTQKPPQTIILEEPESALHPAAQRALLSLFQEWAKDRLFVIATHAPVLLDWAPARSRVHLVDRHHGVSNLTEVTTAPKDVLTALGVRLSDVLTAEAVLLVEGPTDRDILSTWFADALVDPRFAVVPTAGGDAARHSRTMADWFASADQVGTRRIVFLRDHDELPDETVAKLRKGGRVHVLEVRELENYLLDAEALTVYFRSLTGRAHDVATILDSAVEHERRVVLIKRVLARLSLPRLIDHELRNELASATVDLNFMRAALHERLTSSAKLDALLDELWSTQTLEVERLWPEQRLALVGGPDVLETVFQQVLHRGYSKSSDGPELARLVTAPAELTALVRDMSPP